MTTLTTTPHRLDNAHPNVALTVLIAAKQRRIEAIQGWASETTLERERAELAKMEAQS